MPPFISISSHASFDFPKFPKRQQKKRSRSPPISISTDPSHLHPLRLRDLFLTSNHSCHRFPVLSADGRVDPVDPDKLRIAIAHSSVVVSVFCRAKFLTREEDLGGALGFRFQDYSLDVGSPAESLELVGFGRAVSDGGLTASIHDVVVIPSLRRLGIGRSIVNRIVRMLTSKGIYDISALCSENDRLFFKVCGFGTDSLGSTTMMYTRTAKDSFHSDVVVKPAGRLLLFVPPAREPHTSKRMGVEADDHIKVENGFP